MKTITLYACHCDLEPGMHPDYCVFDTNNPNDCCIAIKLQSEGKDRSHCKDWQPTSVNLMRNN